MKRFLSILLVAVMLLSALMLTACQQNEEVVYLPVDNVNGVDPLVAYKEALTYIEEEADYTVAMDITATFRVAFLNIPLKGNDVYTYSYCDGNAHHVLTDAGSFFLGNELVKGFGGDLIGKLNKESWYVDGVFYKETLDGELLKSYRDECPVEKGSVEEIVNEVIDEYVNDSSYYSCFKSESDTMLEIILDGEKVKMDKFLTEVYQIHFDDDGKITMISYMGYAEKMEAELVLNYDYTAEPITAPANADKFTLID